MLRTYKLGEADQILVLLTREHGVVRAVAKGIRKTKSRFGARLDRFSRVNVALHPGRSLANVSDAATVATYAAPIVADVDRYYAASALLELAQVFAAEPDAGGYLFELLDAALAELATYPEAPASGQRPMLPPVAVADRFVLQALDRAGWAPSLVDCAQCGKPGPHRAFHPLAGGAVCVTCRPSGAMTPPPEAVRALWLLAKGRDEVAAEVLASEEGQHTLRTAHSLLSAHVKAQLEVNCKAYYSL